MTLAAHACIGAGLSSLVCVTAGVSPNYGIAVGAVLGASPDLFDWLLYKLNLIERWTLYIWFHHRCPVWLLVLLFPMGIHIAMDRIIHRFPGFNWWPTYWYLEILAWVVGSSMIVFAYLIWAVM